MTIFHIKFDNWEQPQNFHGWRVPWFFVYREHDQQRLFVVGARLYHLMGIKILSKMDSEGEERKEKFEQAFLRYTVRRIEQGLQDGIFPTITTLDEDQWIEVAEADIPLFESLLQEKTCDYQRLVEGRDLLCSAADINDPGKVGQIGLRTVAPTSRATCRICALPDTDYLCSHLVYPLVRSCPAHDTSLLERLLLGASCNLGRDEIRTAPSFCRTGGHQCWERIIEPQSASPQITTNIGHTMEQSRGININIHGSTIHGPVIGDVSGENAEVNYTHNDLDTIKALVSDMLTHYAELSLTALQRTEIEAQLRAIQEQLAAQSPNHSRLREALHTVRHILEAGVAHALVGHWLPVLQAYTHGLG